MAILIDFSGIAHAAVAVMESELQGQSEKEYISIIRHVIITSILSYKKKYSKQYGEVIICCDGPSYWRREYYKPYKANRKKSREESKLDWDLIFRAMSTVRDELELHFPYRVIRLERCEADDVIACLTKYFRTEFGNMQKVMIIAADSDMSQLQQYQEVKQWSPKTKKLIELTRKEVQEFVNVSTVKGQKKDGIPSIKQADDALISEEKIRAPNIYIEEVQKFLEQGIDACVDDEQRRRYLRNQTLFNFDFIPEDINTSIISSYEVPLKKFDRMKLMNFLIQNRCSRLLTSLEDF